jgi:ribosomal protein L17
VKSWRLKYRFAKKEKLLVLGRFPDMKIVTAREARDVAKKLISEGKDPSLHAKRIKLANIERSGQTFEHYARQWFDNQKSQWKEVHANDVITSMENDLFPDLGEHPIADIDEAMLLATLRKVEKRGAIETAPRGEVIELPVFGRNLVDRPAAQRSGPGREAPLDEQACHQLDREPQRLPVRRRAAASQPICNLVAHDAEPHDAILLERLGQRDAAARKARPGLPIGGRLDVGPPQIIAHFHAFDPYQLVVSAILRLGPPETKRVIPAT